MKTTEEERTMATVIYDEAYSSEVSTTTNSSTLGAATTGTLGGSGTVLINGSMSGAGAGGTYWGTYPSTTTTTTVTVPSIALKSDLEDLKKTVVHLSKAVDELNEQINHLVNHYLSAEEWEDINEDSE